MVRFSRISHGPGPVRLFGSSIDKHLTTIRLSIYEGEMEHRLSGDHCSGGAKIIEVELSATQFSELLTTMNMGHGVPCTIKFQQGEGGIESPPDLKNEAERIRDGFEEKMQDLGPVIDERIDNIMNALPKSLKASTRREIEIQLGCIRQELLSNAPFALEQFNRATDRVVATAKGEVEAFVTHAVVTTGLEELQRRLLGNDEEGKTVDVAALPDEEE